MSVLERVVLGTDDTGLILVLPLLLLPEPSCLPQLDGLESLKL